MANINAPVIHNAIMLDAHIGAIQQGLVDNIPWLDAGTILRFPRIRRLEILRSSKLRTRNRYRPDRGFVKLRPRSG